MIMDFFYRSLAYLKSIFTEDPQERTVLALMHELEKTYEKRIAEAELLATYLRQELKDKDAAYNALQAEFLNFAINAGKPVETQVVLPKIAPFNSRGWDQTRRNLEQIARKNATQETIENVEEDLFGPGTTDAFTHGEGSDASS